MKKITRLSVTLEDGTVETYEGTGYITTTHTYIPGDKPGIQNGQQIFTVASHITPEAQDD